MHYCPELGRSAGLSFDSSVCVGRKVVPFGSPQGILMTDPSSTRTLRGRWSVFLAFFGIISASGVCSLSVALIGGDQGEYANVASLLVGLL